MVRVEGLEYLVDAGYGAPFLRPFPRSSQHPVVLELGRNRWVLEPVDATGCSRMRQFRDGTGRHGYLAKPEPRAPEYFFPAIADSFRPSSTFLNAVVLARFEAGRSVVIHNEQLVVSQGSHEAVTALASRDALAEAIEASFGIPAAVTASAVAGLGRLESVWR